jgi:hypothetical protein
LWKKVPKGLKGAGKRLGAIGTVFGALDIWDAISTSNEEIKNINNDASLRKNEKEKEIAKSKKERNENIGGTIGGSVVGGLGGSVLGGLAAGATTGALAGTVAPGIGNAIGAIVGGIVGIGTGIAGYYLGDKAGSAIGGAVSKNPDKMSYGGIIGGDSYSGDKIHTMINSGEMVLNKQQQAQLFSFINNASNILTKVGSENGVTYYNASNFASNVLNRINQNNSSASLNKILSTVFNSNSNVISSALDYNNGIKTLPIGTNSFKPIPRSNDNVGYNDGGIKNVNVRDFNVNLSGTIRLDAGNASKNLDLNALLEDTAFVSSLKDLIKQSINNDINNGRFMNDMASMRGLPSQVTVWGRK